MPVTVTLSPAAIPHRCRPSGPAPAATRELVMRHLCSRFSDLRPFVSYHRGTPRAASLVFDGKIKGALPVELVYGLVDSDA